MKIGSNEGKLFVFFRGLESIFTGSLLDLGKGMGWDWVEGQWCNGKGGGLWLVSTLSVSYEFENEFFTVGVEEADFTLGFYGPIRSTSLPGCGDLGTIAGLELEAVLARIAGVEHILLIDLHRFGVEVAGPGHGNGDEGKETDLRE